MNKKQYFLVNSQAPISAGNVQEKLTITMKAGGNIVSPLQELTMVMGRQAYRAEEVSCTLTRSCYPKGYAE